MAKYAIVKITLVASGSERWEAHYYDWKFKIFGPCFETEVVSAYSYNSADECEDRLKSVVQNNGKCQKYEIVRIVEH